MDDDLPLRIDIRKEEVARSGHWKALGRIIQKYSPFMIYHDPPFGRTSLEAQLSQRSTFPFENWALIAPIRDVRTVLEIIQRELRWPNCNFNPKDKVKLVMTGCDLDSLYALSAIQKYFCVEYSKADTDRIGREDWTLDMLVLDILQRRSGEH